MEMNSDEDVNVTLEEDMTGKELVVCSCGAGQIKLSPHQARILAGKLIMAVNRAEVRINLKHDFKLSRKLLS
jgi:hypothetical protein